MYDMVQSPSLPGDRHIRFNHVPGGGNVLYMDGHVRFIKYPGNFPMVDDPRVIREISHFGLL